MMMFSSSNYSKVDHFNSLFPSQTQVGELQDVVDYLTRGRVILAAAREASKREISLAREDMRKELIELSLELERIRGKLVETNASAGLRQRRMEELTDEIKRLDAAKRNLTMSMRVLRRLQMLHSAYEQLLVYAGNAQWKETAQLYGAVTQLMAFFKPFRSVELIAGVSRDVAALQGSLLEQVNGELKSGIKHSRGVLKLVAGASPSALADCCKVIEALGNDFVESTIQWYCNGQLREYRTMFPANDEVSSLENVDRRYAWCKKILQLYDTEHAQIFPAGWKVSERLCQSFCSITNADIHAQINAKLDAQVLLSALKETIDFETWLDRRFAGLERSSIDTTSSRDDRPSPFGKSLSSAFEPFLAIYIDSQSDALANFIQNAMQSRAIGDGENETVLQSSADLFLLYRKTLATCAKLTSGKPLLQLSAIFDRNLKEYAENVLEGQLSRERHFQAYCMILNTADYCLGTIQGLEIRVKSKLDSDIKESVTFEGAQEAFLNVANKAIRALVRQVQGEYEIPFRTLVNTNWEHLEAVEDKSGYVDEVVGIFQKIKVEVVPLITKERYVRAYCDRQVEIFIMDYLGTIVNSRPISEVGAEQLLLDLYAIRPCLTELPGNRIDKASAAGQSFGKFVTRALQRVETLLKVILTAKEPKEGLVNNYIFLVGDKSAENFSKILDLKGIRKSDQGSYLGLFNTTVPDYPDLESSSQLIGSIQLVSNSTNTPTQAAPPRFDPAQLGSAIFSAAKEGVDRLPRVPSSSSPTLNSPGGDALPQQTSSRINENIRNFGRLFRRDMSNKFSRTRPTDGQTPSSRPSSEL